MKVLLHGFMGDPSIWNALEIPGILAPALWGHGPQGSDGQIAKFEDEVERLSQLIASKRSTSIHLVGYSLGARIALGIAATIPIARLTIVSGRDGLSSADERVARVQHDEAWAMQLDACGDRNAFAQFLARWDAQPIFRTRATDSVLASRLEHDPHRLALALRTLSLGQMPVYAPQVKCSRVDVIVGSNDTKFCALAGPLAASLGAEIKVVPNAGHDLPREAPAALARIIQGREE